MNKIIHLHYLSLNTAAIQPLPNLTKHNLFNTDVNKASLMAQKRNARIIELLSSRNFLNMELVEN